MPENWSGRVESFGARRARLNQGVARYRELKGRHLDPRRAADSGTDVIALKARTASPGSSRRGRPRARLPRRRAAGASARRTRARTTSSRCWRSTPRARPCGSRSWSPSTPPATAAISEPLEAAEKSVARYSTFDEALDVTGRVGRALGRLRPTVPRDERVQFLLRFHASHVLQVCSPQTADHDAGVPARGLNGEAYRGHVFWDELYVYPFLNFRLPRDHARPPAVPLPADRRGPGGGT